jgi:hypothetical protein
MNPEAIRRLTRCRVLLIRASMYSTVHLQQVLSYLSILIFSFCAPLYAHEYEDNDPNQSTWSDEYAVSPAEIGVGGSIRRENPYQLEAEGRRPVHMHVRWESRYVSEGRDNLDGDGLTSVFSDISMGNFTFAPWLAYGYESEYTEVNLNFIYGLKLANQLEIYAGYTHLQNRLESRNSKDNEMFADLVYMPTELFDVLVNCYHSFEASGFFWKFALKREQMLNDKTVLTMRSILGVNEGYVPDGHQGLNHLQLRLNMAWYPASRIEITPYLAYNFAIDRQPERFADDATLRDFFWGGIGVIYHF